MDQRTWVFIANRMMSDHEVEAIQEALSHFVSSWKTHGTPIQANGFCVEKAVVVIAANESEVQASGCSIDKINQLIHTLGTSLGIDFFNRFNVLNRTDDGHWAIERYSPQNANTCINANIISLNELNQLLIK
ncbi:MAG: hypothetical protein ACKO4Y_10130 [Flavobacteriales bacterium]